MPRMNARASPSGTDCRPPRARCAVRVRFALELAYLDAPGYGAAMRSPSAEPYFMRAASLDDLPELLRLAEHLDSVNLPHDEAVLGRIVEKSRASFAAEIPLPEDRQYMFVLQGADSGRVAGTSTVFAQHGRPDTPHVFFDVVSDERYSSTLGRLFSHTTLRLGFSYSGPTEIGALVLDPALRSSGLGRVLSMARFLFIAMHRDLFKDEVIAELMPPLLPDGRSELWEYIGKRFTGLSYQEADRLSHENKEFIYALFPQTPLYASMLPSSVAELIGQVGEATRGAERILRKIGFEYSGQIDPFDGGPHFSAKTDAITLVAHARTATVLSAADAGHPPPGARIERCLVGNADVSTELGALLTADEVWVQATGVSLFPETMRALSLEPGAQVWVSPLEAPT